jgi:hypothetical protein
MQTLKVGPIVAELKHARFDFKPVFSRQMSVPADLTPQQRPTAGG